MGARITVHIFSGRPNPVFTLTDRQAATLLAGLRRPKGAAGEVVPLPAAPTLGYRGLTVELTRGQRIAGLPRQFRVANGDVFSGADAWPGDTALEDFVCGSTGPLKRLKLGGKVRGHLVDEIARFHETRRHWHHHHPGGQHAPPANPCSCGPLYEPAWWTPPPIVGLNNCYNYACDYRSDDYAWPGYAAGAPYSGPPWCANVTPACVADDLTDSPAADNKCPPQGHLVALFIANGIDFHFYRKDATGFWSHKMGSEAPTNLDNGGNPITDPRTCLRGLYATFCTFFVVMHGHISIAGPPVPPPPP